MQKEATGPRYEHSRMHELPERLHSDRGSHRRSGRDAVQEDRHHVVRGSAHTSKHVDGG